MGPRRIVAWFGPMTFRVGHFLRMECRQRHRLLVADPRVPRCCTLRQHEVLILAH